MDIIAPWARTPDGVTHRLGRGTYRPDGVTHPCGASAQGAEAAARLVVRCSLGSTSATLLEELTGADGFVSAAGQARWPHLSALQAREQTAGRGRAGRSWLSGAGDGLAVSFVVRPLVPVEELGWLALVAGVGVCEALEALVDPAGRAPWRVVLKWPNDVVVVPRRGRAHVPGQSLAGRREDLPGWAQARKLCGVLVDSVLPGPEPVARPERRQQAVCAVVGVGVNVRHAADRLPVPWAASLAACGWETTVDRVRDAVGHGLAEVIGQWEQEGLDGPRGLRGRVEQRCWTLGQEVRVNTPSGCVSGLAVGVEPGLVLVTGASGDPDTAGERVVVQAGDVHVVRVAGEESGTSRL